jgi:hypothetical protein
MPLMAAVLIDRKGSGDTTLITARSGYKPRLPGLADFPFIQIPAKLIWI